MDKRDDTSEVRDDSWVRAGEMNLRWRRRRNYLEGEIIIILIGEEREKLYSFNRLAIIKAPIYIREMSAKHLDFGRIV